MTNSNNSINPEDLKTDNKKAGQNNLDDRPKINPIKIQARAEARAVAKMQFITEFNKRFRTPNPDPFFLEEIDERALGYLLIAKIKNYIADKRKGKFKIGTVSFTVTDHKNNHKVPDKTVRVLSLSISFSQANWRKIRKDLGDAPLDGINNAAAAIPVENDTSDDQDPTLH